MAIAPKQKKARALWRWLFWNYKREPRKPESAAEGFRKGRIGHNGAGF